MIRFSIDHRLFGCINRFFTSNAFRIHRNKNQTNTRRSVVEDVFLDLVLIISFLLRSLTTNGIARIAQLEDDYVSIDSGFFGSSSFVTVGPIESKSYCCSNGTILLVSFANFIDDRWMENQ